MSCELVRLADVVERTTGTRNPTATLETSFTYVDVAAIDNVGKAIVSAREVLAADAPSRARKLIRSGDILISTVRPNLNAVATVPPELDGQIASTGFCVLRATAIVLPEYLFFFVRSGQFIDGLTSLVAGALYPAVTDRQVLNQRLPLPPLPEQRRIVDILSRAEGIVRLRREAEKKAAELIPALFIDLFGDPATNPKGWNTVTLGEIASVQGGLQLTKARASHPLERPYLRVANVHRSRLELGEIKQIRLSQTELERTRLLPKDLLLVEGHGNPQEIGRVAMWDDSIHDCVHQNHLIRARLNNQLAHPVYICEFLNSQSGRQFLLRSGKTTSGLSTISVSNVRAATILLPEVSRQNAFAEQVAAIRSIQSQQSAATAKAQASFDALLAEAFGG